MIFLIITINATPKINNKGTNPKINTSSPPLVGAGVGACVGGVGAAVVGAIVGDVGVAVVGEGVGAVGSNVGERVGEGVGENVGAAVIVG